MATEASEGSAAPPSPASTTAKNGDKSKKRASPSGDSEQPAKVTKRRAARACVSCRARKVRCDVVEGAPCGNCRWDNVEVWIGCLLSLNGSSILGHSQLTCYIVRRARKPSTKVSKTHSDSARPLVFRTMEFSRSVAHIWVCRSGSVEWRNIIMQEENSINGSHLTVQL